MALRSSALFALLVAVLAQMRAPATQAQSDVNTASANPPATTSIDRVPSEADSLLTVIQSLESDIATKAILQDTDYAPGIVQVFRRQDLEARGARTVGEALMLVPGVDVPIDNLGLRQPVIRGFGGILSGATGKLKILLNGVSLNSTQSAEGGVFYDIPIGEIERIDIIRGPGSAVYGEYAFLGVVNVISRGDGNNVFLRYDNDGTVTAGALIGYTTGGGVNVSLNVSGWGGDGADVIAGEDALFAQGMGGLSNAPGPTNETRENISAVFRVDKGGFSFLTQYLDSGQGDYFGAVYLPPPDKRKIISNRWLTAEAKQVVAPSAETEVRLTLGWKEFTNQFDDIQLTPPGFLGIYPAGQIADTNHEEEAWYGVAEVVWTALTNQTWLIGAEYVDIDVKSSYTRANFDPRTVIPGTPFLVPLPEKRLFDGDLVGRDRGISSLYVQDQIEYGERLSFTAGIRYDRYSDVGEALTPRLAAVLRLTDQHVFKAQYAQAFRPPTFVELYSTAAAARGNPNIEPETVDTIELGYVFKTARTVFRATVFYSDFKDLIISENFQFANASGATVKGLDLELEKQFSRGLKLEGDVSYADTDDDRTGQPLEGSADWIVNLALVYQPVRDFSMDLRYRYIDNRHRAVTDPRDDLNSTSLVNLTASLFNVGIERVTLRLGVSNLLDADVSNPAPFGTYPEDFPRPGRTFWTQVSLDL